MFRQGDVWIVPCDATEIPTDAALVGHCIVARGEATGHMHRIEKGAKQYATPSGQQWIKVFRAKVELLHQEHSAVVLLKGTYRVIHQREYSPEGLKGVID